MLDPYLLAEGSLPDAPVIPSMDDYDSFDDFFTAMNQVEETIAAFPAVEEDDLQAQYAFLQAMLPHILLEQAGQNMLVSPMNIYFALGLLAEISAGNTQAQLLRLLQAEDSASLSSRLQAMWYSIHRTYAGSPNGMAASLWLDEHFQPSSTLLTSLADLYDVSTYQGQMGSDAFNQAFSRWLAQATQASPLSHPGLSAQSMAALAATINYKVAWQNSFQQDNTSPGMFNAPTGHQPADFMHKSTEDLLVQGRHFDAMALPFVDGGEIRLILPHPSVRPEALLQDQQAVSYLCGAGDEADLQRTFCPIDLALPKFDVTCNMDLTAHMAALGITDAFLPGQADFSPLTDDGMDFVLSQIQHAARMKVDEDGMAAAAFTVLQLSMAAAPSPEKPFPFVLDRPFLFEVLAPDGSILFIGMVNTIEAQ